MSSNKVLLLRLLYVNVTTVAACEMNDGVCAPSNIASFSASESCLLQDKMVKNSTTDLKLSALNDDASEVQGGVVRSEFFNADALNDQNGTTIQYGATIVSEFAGRPTAYWFDPQTSSEKFLVADPVTQIRLPREAVAIGFDIHQFDSEGSEMKMLLLTGNGTLVATLDKNSGGFVAEPARTREVEQGSAVIVQSATPFRSVVIENPSSSLIGNLFYVPCGAEHPE